jgi:tetratricopeptide (TPR) repeat protein
MLVVCLGGWFAYREFVMSSGKPFPEAVSDGLAGSATCRQCHKTFYELWAPSHHGLAMQPYKEQFALTNLTCCEQEIEIGGNKYQAFVDKGEGFILERDSDSERKLPIVHVLGGKNVYYFLTPLAKGRLQTLPLAYDVRLKQWFDTAASAVRHFSNTQIDEALNWTDHLYTFNTSCYSCHVSQLTRNYDIDTDTYRTIWAEPGISCETCHGPAKEHVRMYQQARKEGSEPEGLGLISTKEFSTEQINAMCNSCHAKMRPITASFKPGDRYFDRFDLVTLEDPDFYPDGRDLGENYTMTSWRISPCVKSGQLDCMHCHTSSGRYRFKNSESPNAACLPCHSDKVENATAHSHHEVGSDGNSCVACHMPMTRFARMARSDHSMRPPMPAITLGFQSPNACNICHESESAKWADEHVRQWHDKDYQKPVLELASLLRAARGGNWDVLKQVLTYLRSSERDEIFATSLIRSMATCESELKWPTIIEILRNDPSPLVRAAAAHTLTGNASDGSIQALLQATKDEYRLVRVRAAESLASIPAEHLPGEHRENLQRATAELMESFNARPDDYVSRYNKGNFHMDRREHEQALESYRLAIELRPDFVPSYVNIAFVYYATGKYEEAERAFRKAAALDTKNAAIRLNLGMLLAELQQPEEAEQAFREALEADPNSAAAAYNLGILLAGSRPQESLNWCQKAFNLRPEEGKYGYTYGYFLSRLGQTDNAIEVLEDMIDRLIPYSDAYALLGSIYTERGNVKKATYVYRAGWSNDQLDLRVRQEFKALAERRERDLNSQ